MYRISFIQNILREVKYNKVKFNSKFIHQNIECKVLISHPNTFFRFIICTSVLLTVNELI